MTTGWPSYRAVNPLDELRTARYPSSAGLVAVGRGDAEYRRQAQQIAAATRAAGMSVGLIEFDGGHSWSMAADALDRALLWLAGRGGMLDRVTARMPV
jgi:S-formylglutathione hydrolase FrmB